MKSVECQANLSSETPLWLREQPSREAKCRPLEELLQLMKTSPTDAVRQMSNEELLSLLSSQKLKHHQLEKELGDDLRAVYIRCVIEFHSFANKHPRKSSRSGFRVPTGLKK